MTETVSYQLYLRDGLARLICERGVNVIDNGEMTRPFGGYKESGDARYIFPAGADGIPSDPNVMLEETIGAERML